MLKDKCLNKQTKKNRACKGDLGMGCNFKDQMLEKTS